MSKKRHYTPKSFESSRASNDTFAQIYCSMVTSPAYKSLSRGQKQLYTYMKLEYYNGKNKPNGDSLCFYFNKRLYQSKYGIYSNNAQFIRDKDALIEKGFITCEDGGATTRTKAVYRFSDEWQNYGTDRFRLNRSKMSESLNRKRNSDR